MPKMNSPKTTRIRTRDVFASRILAVAGSVRLLLQDGAPLSPGTKAGMTRSEVFFVSGPVYNTL